MKHFLYYLIALAVCLPSASCSDAFVELPYAYPAPARSLAATACPFPLPNLQVFATVSSALTYCEKGVFQIIPAPRSSLSIKGLNALRILPDMSRGTLFPFDAGKERID